MRHVPDPNVHLWRGADQAGRRLATEHLKEEAKKRANDPNAFMEAVKDNDAFMVKLLLKNEEIIITREDSLSALKIALKKGNSTIVNLLLDDGRIGEIKGQTEWRRLFISALASINKEPNFFMAGLLLEKGRASEPHDLDRAFEFFIFRMNECRDECRDERAVSIVKTFINKGAILEKLIYQYVKNKAKESDFYKATAELLEKCRYEQAYCVCNRCDSQTEEDTSSSEEAVSSFSRTNRQVLDQHGQ